MDPNNDYLRYDRMVEGALRSVVSQALTEVAKHGLLGSHHFYISFQTGFPGVKIPDYLRAKYPDIMTIVLQYQFYELVVEKEQFAVSVSFNNVPERLIIPLAAVTSFVDPSTNFALQFQNQEEDDEEEVDEGDQNESIEEDSSSTSDEGGSEPPKTGQVISLDSFRKRK